MDGLFLSGTRAHSCVSMNSVAKGSSPSRPCRSPPRRSRSAALFVAKVCHLHRGCLHLDLVACAVGDRATPGWARCPAVARLPSLSCCSATGVMLPTCMELAEDMKEKCNVDIDTRFFEWSQHTAVESRHEDQGSSCCGLFAALTIQSWAESDKRATMFQNWYSADFWRPHVQSAVQKWDKAISTDP